ncbi:MAG TPA: hypothetical protein VIJ60_10065 [Acidimicrobiales bacterium]
MKRALAILMATSALGVMLPMTAGAATHRKATKPVHKAQSSAAALKAAGSYYLAAVTPVNVAFTQLSKAATADGSSATAAELATQAAPALAALTTCDGKLADYTWPKVAEADIKALLADGGAVAGALQSVAGITALDASSWETSFDQATQVLGNAANVVRHDLGLPPAPSD